MDVSKLYAVEYSLRQHDWRISDEGALRCQIAVWEASRNRQQATVDWQSTTSDARIKLNRLYPDISRSL